MTRIGMQKTLSYIVTGAVVAVCGILVYLHSEVNELPNMIAISPPKVTKSLLVSQLGPTVQKNVLPEFFDLKLGGQSRHVLIQYGLEPQYQKMMEKMMTSFAPDFGAFVALDAKTGRIIAMVSQERGVTASENMTLQSKFPAASVFKVVTASAAIDSKKASPETVVAFNGANHTLYKHNVEDTRTNRWTRHMTMREAFSRSVNVFFAKLGLYYVGGEQLMNYAERYQFNRAIRSDVPIEMGRTSFSSADPWSVITAASGFTQDNTMSPLHGALIAATAANDGVMMEPYLVESLTDEAGHTLYTAESKQMEIPISAGTAADLRKLMIETVKRGTSRKWFRPVTRRHKFDDVEMGGKTGSLTGDEAEGKCDWFVGYARYKNEKIAVGALTVNQKKWRVKASYLASQFLSAYVGDIKDQERAISE